MIDEEIPAELLNAPVAVPAKQSEQHFSMFLVHHFPAQALDDAKPLLLLQSFSTLPLFLMLFRTHDGSIRPVAKARVHQSGPEFLSLAQSVQTLTGLPSQ